ncbi:TetR/AcrR family transcriptional regulator [Ancylomarina sp. 16SWW S1-10-2]|uniref:TetR/AcrR family transcriptional regulator n=1 Tax=Ancylomarina sp. 16SWW S1-10-2 TaxID=2499681 RepID=UPI0012ADC5F6|nr:TetR/AcrR family transcriptional regulator [Ancylomarina sp. 16SWW S1-10-2]MRT92893.1 TetR/AcrR family transcriptional regulator [Ancylomarina sp. 16SWW S1-10-2]
MTSRNNDNQVSRTKDSIANTFFELIYKNPGKPIKVKDLCLEAGYARQTFYTHFYQLQDVVYYYYEREYLTYIKEETEKLYSINSSIKSSFNKFLRIVFDYWHTQNDTYKMLKSIDLDDVLLKLFQETAKIFTEKFYPNANIILTSFEGKSMIKAGAHITKTVYDIWVTTGRTWDTDKMVAISSPFFITVLSDFSNSYK